MRPFLPDHGTRSLVTDHPNDEVALTPTVTERMATDHIRISVEAKRRLESRKREDESYTDVIMRLTDRNDDAERFVGKYDDVDLAAGVENVKDRMDRDFRRENDVRRQ